MSAGIHTSPRIAPLVRLSLHFSTSSTVDTSECQPPSACLRCFSSWPVCSPPKPLKVAESRQVVPPVFSRKNWRRSEGPLITNPKFVESQLHMKRKSRWRQPNMDVSFGHEGIAGSSRCLRPRCVASTGMNGKHEPSQDTLTAPIAGDRRILFVCILSCAGLVVAVCSICGTDSNAHNENNRLRFIRTDSYVLTAKLAATCT